MTFLRHFELHHNCSVSFLPNAGGFGSIKDAREAYWYNEIIPEQNRIENTINEWAGDRIIGFKSFEEVEPTKK